MNQLVIIVLIFFGLAWLFYLAGFRDKRIAFILWFPLTVASFLGTLTWLWLTLALLLSPRAKGEAEGWMAYGAAIAFGVLLICPIVLAISIWQRPRAGAYSLSRTLPVIALCSGLPFLYRPLSGILENKELQIVVLDTMMKPVAGATVEFNTKLVTYQFSFPSTSMSGKIETGPNGTVILPVPKTHELDCKISKVGYAIMNVHMDRAWGNYNWHQTTVEWQFPIGHLWRGQGGTVQTDVGDANPMRLTVYLPTENHDIPNYGPIRIYDGEQKNWILQPSKINLY